MPVVEDGTRDRKYLFPRKVRHPRASVMRPKFGRDRDSDDRQGPTDAYLSTDLAKRRRRAYGRAYYGDAAAASRRHAPQETLSSVDSCVGDQLVETVLLDLQVERAFRDPELFGRQGQIAVTRHDGCADSVALHRFQIHDR